MKLSLLALVGSAVLAPLGHAQQFRMARPEMDVKMPSGLQPVANPLPPSPVLGSDSCATAEVIPPTGTGVIAFNSTGATSSIIMPYSEGQQTFTGGECLNGCAQYGNGQVAIPLDVWFSWTPSVTGRVLISTCPTPGTGSDTKIAVYDVPCASLLGSAACVACNDDYQNAATGALDAGVIFNATASTTYLIQVGSSSFAPLFSGPGTFRLEYVDLQTDGQWDSGIFWNALGLGAANGDGIMYMNGFKAPPGTVTVSSVEVAWGATGCMTCTANGTPITIGIYDDPTDDQNPVDAVLLATTTGVSAGQGTDTFFSFAFTPPVAVTGDYFVAVTQITTGVDFGMALGSDTCDQHPNSTWFGERVGVAYDLGTVGNVLPGAPNTLFRLGAQCGFGTTTRHSVAAIRTTQVIAPLDTPFTSYCSATDAGEVACPCGNPGAGLGGCGNAANAGGAIISSTGVAKVTGDTLVLNSTGGLPFGPGLYYQGSATATGGVAAPFGVTFGNGRRCAGGATPRIEIRVADGAGASNTTVSISAFGGPIVGGPVTGVRFYQLWYRDGAAPFCTSAGFNLSNAIQLVWAP